MYRGKNDLFEDEKSDFDERRPHWRTAQHTNVQRSSSPQNKSSSRSDQSQRPKSSRGNSNNSRGRGQSFRLNRDHSQYYQQGTRGSAFVVYPDNDFSLSRQDNVVDPNARYQRQDFMKSPDKRASISATKNFQNIPFRRSRKDESSSSYCSDGEPSSSSLFNKEAGSSNSFARGYANRRDDDRKSAPSTARDSAAASSNRRDQGYGNSSDKKYDRRGDSNFSVAGAETENEVPRRDNHKKNKRTIVISDGKQKNEINAKGGKAGKMFVGFKYLKEQSENEDVAKLVAELQNPDAALPAFLEKRDLQPDWLFLLVKIVSKVCSFELKSIRNETINQICQSEFLHAVSYYLGEVGIEERHSTIKNIPAFLKDLIEFYHCVVKYLPSVAVDKDLPKLIAKTKKAVDSLGSDHGLSVDEDSRNKLDVLSAKVEEFKNMLVKPPKTVEKKTYLQFLSDQPPPDDFRNLDLYPTYEDLTRHSFGFVRPNKTKGAYDDEEHYLDVQFRLLREDFIDPIRRALNLYLKDKAEVGKVKPKFKYESLRLYPKSKFLEVRKNEKNQLAFVVNFDPNKKMRIKWEYSKRFMFGSLLLFTDDEFTTFFYGTVFERSIQLLTEGNILVTFPNDVQADKNLFSKTFLMAESEVFFEPYFLVMKSLKTLNAENFPMSKYIVRGESNTNHPSYKSQDVLWSVLDYEVDPYDTEYWPSPKQLGLDAHQHRAFQKALTSEFCVIQGPPGTGKTFIGLKIVQVLLQNITLNQNRIRSPLLVVCFTNHALDQFLEGILQYTRKIIRVGGQSRSEVLKDFHLRGRNQLSVRHSAAAKKQLAPAMIKIRDEIKETVNEICSLTARKDKLESPEGILKYDILRSVMTEEQQGLLTDAKTLLHWLLEPADDGAAERRREKRASADAKKKNPKAMEVDEVKEVKMECEEEEDDEADNQLVDEDDIFEMDAATKAFLNSTSPYEVTRDEMAAKLKELIETAQYLQSLDDDAIDDIMGDYATYLNELGTREREIKVMTRQFYVLEEQLEDPNYSVESTRRVLAKDVRHLSVAERWPVYWSWIKVLRENVIQELQGAEERHRNKMSQYDDVKQMEDLYVAQQADVVGMTTTCAARLHTLLNALKPAIVVVEEAAEVLESHIVTSLTKSCQHVILIGDHKQLKPSAAVYQLARDYKIDVSLFERMINNGMDCPMLNVQHRMRPEISSLIAPLIYNDLKDDPSVFKFENIEGMVKNLFFLEHDHFEQNVDDTSSRQNAFEADFLIELCYYLVLQGYDPDEITILTTYTGQMYALRERKRQRQLMQHVKCIVVDKYQGEENDIILLSLVRSNKEATIGFLKTENRVCVALSRARKGFFIVGNMENLKKSSPDLWGKIAENLRTKNAIGKEMPLYCSRHEIYTLVSCPKDFDKVREGGCSKFCGELLACGHNCQRLCHPLDREHLETKCHEICGRKCPRERHECKKLCFQDCGNCMEKLEWDLCCGHTKILACHVDLKTYLCDEIVDDVSPLCNHAVKRKCHEKPEDVDCLHPCEDRLECGHACEYSCHKKRDPDHQEYKCKKPCEKQNKMCSREHKCEKSCFEACGLCTIKVDFTLKCGHQKKLRCSIDIDKVKCFEDCKKICPDCNQKCRKKCFEDCSPCENKVTKIISDCKHAVNVPCHARPTREDCGEMCERLLMCGHKCKSRCRNACRSTECKELVKLNVRGLCGHDFVRVRCYERSAVVIDEEELRNLLAFCDAPCDTFLKCGDPCGGTCGKCWQGRLHQLCKKDCGSVGICGHSCKYPCRQMCPPCEESCGYRCKHSKCPKKCGVPCVQCKEPCDWQCEHTRCTKKCGQICDREPCTEACPVKLECGHPCIGFCGEPCPPECRVCNEEITEILFGYEDEEDSRFVYLVDCKHTIESRALDMHLNATPNGGEIVMKVCPLCKTPIARTLRYMNYVKKTYENILKVKKKIFGTESTLKQRRIVLERNILQFVSSNGTNFRATGLKKIQEMGNEYLRKIGGGQKKNNQNTVSNAELNTIEFFYLALVEINSRLESLCEHDLLTKRDKLHGGVVTERVVKFVKALLARMNEPAIQVNQQLSEDLASELRRYHKMVDYSLVMRNESYLARRHDHRVLELVGELAKLVFGVERFDRVERRIDRAFEDLQEALKASASLTSDEKRMIHLAMSSSFLSSSSTGHWFTCSNGHPYVITECGGAMQKSKCPECGEVIGGENHQTVSTAVLTSDFDGAQHPAWSSRNDMRNFGFNL